MGFIHLGIMARPARCLGKLTDMVGFGHDEEGAGDTEFALRAICRLVCLGLCGCTEYMSKKE